MELFRQVFEIYQEIGKRIRKVKDGHKTNYRSNNSKNLNLIPPSMASLITAGEKSGEDTKEHDGEWTTETHGGRTYESQDAWPSNRKKNTG